MIKENYYDKQNIWNALGNKPVVLCLVRWQENEKGLVDSRLCQSCVICLAGHKQDDIDENKSSNESPDSLGAKIHINADQFMTEEEYIQDTISEYNQRHGVKWVDSWQRAWGILQQWEKNYHRPRKYGYMSEKERLGNYDSRTLNKYINVNI